MLRLREVSGQTPGRQLKKKTMPHDIAGNRRPTVRLRSLNSTAPFKCPKQLLYEGKCQTRDTFLKLIFLGATWPAAGFTKENKAPQCLRCEHSWREEEHRMWHSLGVAVQRAEAELGRNSFRELGNSSAPAFTAAPGSLVFYGQIRVQKAMQESWGCPCGP